MVWHTCQDIMALDWIIDRRPTEEDSDKDGHVRLAVDDSYTLVGWNAVAEGAAWSHTQRWLDVNHTEDILVGWINNRLPQEEDGDIDGDVMVRPDPDDPCQDEFFILWSAVQKGQAWRHAGPVRVDRSTPYAGKRTFISVIPYPHPGDHTLVAVASDGTAWELSRFGPVWSKLPSLPQS